MGTSKRYSAEVRERAVWMVGEHLRGDIGVSHSEEGSRRVRE
jgi:hypothetical protein